MRNAVSAGGVVYRRAPEGGVEIVLVARPAQRLWALPKGTPEPGESIEQTARREVTEETGLQVEIAGDLGSIRYRYAIQREGVLVQKVVYYYLMEPTGGDVSLHDHEYDVVDWVDIHLARERMSYSNDRAVVERAAAMVVGSVGEYP